MTIPDDGVMLIDKPIGMTSFGVVARIKRLARDAHGRKIKVGHTGTLDPFASGLMIVVLGKACKRAGDYSKLSKSYSAKIILGQTTPTYDIEGNKTHISRCQPSLEQIQMALENFRGKIHQYPPAYSALKINGIRAYQLARLGKDFKIKPREVEVTKLVLKGYKYPILEIESNVTSGTYIRSLAHDLGSKLGVGAYCSSLRRLSVGEYKISEATRLTDLTIG